MPLLTIEYSIKGQIVKLQYHYVGYNGGYWRIHGQRFRIQTPARIA